MVTAPNPGFYRPDHGWVGDVIPFASDGQAWLFYLHEDRSQPKPGTPWRLLSTRDFVHFTDHGVAIPSGGAEAEDFNAYTGSVVEHSGRHHLFYTAQNPDRLGPDGQPLQLVARATSVAGLTEWSKEPELTFGAPAGYETGDWRDPFVFRVPGEDDWRMLVTARVAEGPDRRRGVIAQLRSSDLMHWTPTEPFYAPHRYIAMECPDVFQWGDWWYLVYSEFSDAFVTRYRIAPSPDGPWKRPPHDSIDGRAFYASKSVALGDRRFLVGWIATKEGERDAGAYEWAGTLSTLEMRQREDGTLDFTTPREVRAAYSQPTPRPFPASAGDAEAPHDQAHAVTVDGLGGYAEVISERPLPGAVRLRCTVEIGDDVENCGVQLRASADGDAHYALRLEPARNRMVFDSWPRPRIGAMQWEISGDVPHAVELERPCDLGPGPHTLDVIVSGSTVVATIDDMVTLSARMYDRTDGHLGLFASEGVCTFRDLQVATTLETGTDAGILDE